jgi:hypothetical protein
MQASEAGSAVSNSADAATAARSLDAAEPLQTRGRPELGNAGFGEERESRPLHMAAPKG